MLSDSPHFAHLSLPDQLRLTALEAEDLLPLPMLEAIQRAADLLEEAGWAGPSGSYAIVIRGPPDSKANCNGSEEGCGNR